MSRNTYVLLGVLGLVVLLGIWHEIRIQNAVSLARTIILRCKSASDHSPCYESEVPKLYPDLTVPQIFDVVREIRREDTTYQFCHVLGHKIGERIVAEDPARWVEAIPLNPPDGLCSNGFIHGVIGGRFRAEVLNDATIQKFLPDFTRACAPRANWQPSDLDRAICYHGMGHLYDFITNADLPKALTLCAETAPENFQRVCIEGVFMQIYQPLEPDDFLLIKQMPVQPSTTTVRQFCAAYKDPVYAGACLRESWPYYTKEILDGSSFTKFCAGQPNKEQEDTCYEAAFTIVGRLSLGKPEDAARACGRAPTTRQTACYSIVADAILEEDRLNAKDALAFCARAPGAIADSCILSLVSKARFNFGQDVQEYNLFCAALPASYQQTCLDSKRSY